MANKLNRQSIKYKVLFSKDIWVLYLSSLLNSNLTNLKGLIQGFNKPKKITGTVNLRRLKGL